MKRFKGSGTYPFEDALYDLIRDPGEKSNLIEEDGFAGVAQQLSARIDAFFQLNRYRSTIFGQVDLPNLIRINLGCGKMQGVRIGSQYWVNFTNEQGILDNLPQWSL